jgi:hypothetical protein
MAHISERMSGMFRKVLAVLVLAVALLAGVQQQPALACAMDDAACRDHCAIMADSCATACPARLVPAPLAVVAPHAMSQGVAFSLDVPALAGLTLAPATAPPRSAV